MTKLKLTPLIATALLNSTAVNSIRSVLTPTVSIASNTLPRHRFSRELETAHQKLIQSHREWNDAVNVKRDAKKHRKHQLSNLTS